MNTKVSTHKVIKLGHSLVISIPASFAEKMRINAGDELVCLSSDTLQIMKPKSKPREIK
jgi:antitoxin component of MazEF toxin-antitoxin module